METIDVIGYKFAGTYSNDDLGYIKPLWVVEDNGRLLIAADHFPCSSGKVFIVRGYKALNAKYDESGLFRITARENSQYDAAKFDSCKFISEGDRAQDVEPKQLAEIFTSPVPSPDDPRIAADGLQPATKYVFLEWDGKLFGLFEAVKDTADFEAGFLKLGLPQTPMQPQLRYRKKVHVFDLSQVGPEFVSTVDIRGRTRKFALRVAELLTRRTDDFRLFMAEEDIIRAGTELLERTSPQMVRKENIAVFKKNAASSKFGSSGAPLLDDFFKIIERQYKDSEAISSALESYFKSEKGRQVVQYVFSSSPELLRTVDDALYQRSREKAEKDVKDIRAKREEEETRLRAMRAELEDLAKKKEAAAQEIQSRMSVAEATAELNEATSKQRAELAQVREELASSQARLASVRADLSVADDAQSVQNLIETLRRDESRLRRASDDITQTARKSHDKLIEQLLDLKPFVDTLTGFTPAAPTERRRIKVATKSIDQSSPEVSLTARDQYLSDLCGWLQANGRDLERAEVANLLICLQQNFLTVIAGLPGVGKTSLVHLLSSALGISDCFLRISVGRGWTSSRDLIGYFNPIARRFEPAPTRFAEYLMGVASTRESPEGPGCMSVVLLDEANLSPIEHYWSGFVPMTDDQTARSLALGTDTVALPPGFRFVATINLDNTTEPLSPRILDRAPVISLNANADPAYGAEVALPQFAVPIGVMQEWFGATKRDSEDSRLAEDKLDSILEVATDSDSKFGRPIVLSQRRRLQISAYLKRAAPLMKAADEDLATDFAIRQFVLPLIAGSGEKYRNRLELMLERCEKAQFEQSVERLRTIVDIGKQDLDSYSFFVW